MLEVIVGWVYTELSAGLLLLYLILVVDGKCGGGMVKLWCGGRWSFKLVEFEMMLEFVGAGGEFGVDECGFVEYNSTYDDVPTCFMTNDE